MIDSFLFTTPQCGALLSQDLFGERRIYMLPGMRAFISENQTAVFDRWIDEHVPMSLRARPREFHMADVVGSAIDVVRAAIDSVHDYFWVV